MPCCALMLHVHHWGDELRSGRGNVCSPAMSLPSELIDFIASTVLPALHSLHCAACSQCCVHGKTQQVAASMPAAWTLCTWQIRSLKFLTSWVEQAMKHGKYCTGS